MATTYSWTKTGSVTQNWSSSANWASTTVAGSATSGNTDVVLFTSSTKSAYYVNFDEASPWYVGSVTTNNGTNLQFIQTNASLTIGSGLTIAGNTNTNILLDGKGVSLTIAGGGITESAGAIIVKAGTASITGGVNLSNGTISVLSDSGISGFGTFTADSLNLTGGSVNVGASGASLNVTNTATLTTNSGTAALTISNGTASFGTLVLNGANTVASITGGTLKSTSGGISVGSTDSIQMGGGVLDGSGGGILNSGTVIGYGTVSGAVTGTGTLYASSGVLDVTGNVGSSAVLSVGATASSTLKLESGTSAGLLFQSSTAGVFQLSTAALKSYTGTITGLNLQTTAGSVSGSNYINLSTTSIGNVTVGATNSNEFDGSSTTINIYDTGSTLIGTLTLASAPVSGGFINWAADSSVVGGGSLGGTDLFLDTTVCFAAGTRIATASGDVLVEELAEGDLVVTYEGDQRPVKWIGHRRIDLAHHPRPSVVAPVRIRRDAFGDSQPHRDLVLSPDHCVFIDGRLIPVKLLINGMTIVHELHVSAVQYYHVELEQHSVLLAEGLPTESYLDTGNRAFFANAGSGMILHPDLTLNAALKAWETDACAPFTLDAETVAPIWRRLANRAETLGFVAPRPETTSEPDLHVLANGRAIRPISTQAGRYQFALPAGTDVMRLASRASMPSGLLAYLDDWRQIGVAVTRIEVRGQDTHTVIPADHPHLTRGWHTAESDGSTTWRWTDGSAELRLDPTDGPMILEVHVCNTTVYVVDETPDSERLAA